MSKTRKKHAKTEYEKQRKKFRQDTPMHVVNIEADMCEDDKRHAFNLSDKVRILGNELKGSCDIKIKQLKRETKYKALLKKYGKLKKSLEKLDENSETYKKQERKFNNVKSDLKKLYKKYDISFASVKRQAEIYKDTHDIHSAFALSTAIDVWSATEDILYGKSKKFRYAKKGEYRIIQATQINRGIVLKFKNGTPALSMKGFNDFGLIVPKDDLYLQDEIEAIKEALLNPEIEENAVKLYSETNIMTSTYRPCYCSLKCEEIRGRLRVYVQITVNGISKPKKNKLGLPRHNFPDTGDVGSDIGTQSFSVASNSVVFLKNLAERNSKCTKISEPKERVLQRKMERSKRATNPNKFNKNGTYKKGNKDPWTFSKTYLKTRQKLKDIKRKNRLNRKYAINEDVNTVRTIGANLITETSNAKQLQKKAKFDEENPTKRRKRFGRSVQNRCPGYFTSRLKEVFETTGGTFNTVDMMFRASQYDHKADEYNKKTLSQRWHYFKDGTKCQRDIYSAFLLMCSDEEYKSPDREKCLKFFEQIYKLEEEFVNYIKINNIQICNSGI